MVYQFRCGDYLAMMQTLVTHCVSLKELEKSDPRAWVAACLLRDLNAAAEDKYAGEYFAQRCVNTDNPFEMAQGLTDTGYSSARLPIAMRMDYRLEVDRLLVLEDRNQAALRGALFANRLKAQAQYIGRYKKIPWEEVERALIIVALLQAERVVRTIRADFAKRDIPRAYNIWVERAIDRAATPPKTRKPLGGFCSISRTSGSVERRQS